MIQDDAGEHIVGQVIPELAGVIAGPEARPDHPGKVRARARAAKWKCVGWEQYVVALEPILRAVVVMLLGSHGVDNAPEHLAQGVVKQRAIAYCCPVVPA